MVLKRVAAIYDVHANLPALEAVLAEIRASNVDLVVMGGDIVPGPMPADSLAALLHADLRVECIHGNGDRAVLAVLRGEEPTTVPERVRDVIRWTAAQLAPALEGTIAGWPGSLRLDLPDLGRVLFCHATPRNDTEIFTVETDEAVLRPLFDTGEFDVVICGHTHMPFDRMVGATRVVNAGSVGMPFGETGADWLLIASDIEFRHTTYDLARAAGRIKATAYPGAEEFVAQNVLSCPSKRQMLDAFAAVAVTGVRPGS